MTVEGSTDTWITANKPDNKSNPNANPNPTTKQHTIMNMQL